MTILAKESREIQIEFDPFLFNQNQSQILQEKIYFEIINQQKNQFIDVKVEYMFPNLVFSKT